MLIVIAKNNKKGGKIMDISKEKLALFMVIRNSKVLPKGLELGKTDKEINRMAYQTMQEVMEMIDYEKAKKSYEEGKNN